MHRMEQRLEIEQFICRSDNYGVLIHDPESALTATIDAPDAYAIEAALERRGWTLDFIFTTHHHLDHVEGNEPLKEKFGVSIIGPEAEKAKIPGIDRTVKGGDEFTFGSFQGEGHFHARPYGGWDFLLPAGCESRLHRRHAFRTWLRAAFRGHARHHVPFTRKAGGAAGRYRALLRP